MKAVVLAAGRGKRLRPLTNYILKPLLPIEGKPMIGEVIKNLETLDISEIIVVIGGKGNEIKKYLKNFDAPISYVKQDPPLGTAHALSAASEKIDGDVLVTASDAIYPQKHYEELWDVFARENLDAVLSLKVLDKKQMKESSSVKMGKDGYILKIIEKPTGGGVLSDVACGPVHIYKEVIKDYLNVKKSKRGEYELADSIQAMIDDGLRIKGVLAKEWKSIMTIEDFVRMNFTFESS